ncbi:TPA: hypothetical protein DCX15_02220 [bacterium]|nr:hypothetical protein [bacterium]
MKKNRIIAVSLILIFSLLSVSPEDVWGGPRRRIPKDRRTLEGRIAREKRRLKEIQAQEKKLLKRLNSLDKQIYNTEESISRLEKKLSRLKEEIQALEKDLTKSNRYLARLKDRLANRLRVMYRARHLGHLEVILTSSDLNSFLRWSYFMRLVISQDADLIRKTKESIEAIKTRQDKLLKKEKEFQKLKKVEEKAKKLRESQRKSQKKLLAKVSKNKQINMLKIKELERAYQEIKKMISRSEKSRLLEKGRPRILDPELAKLKSTLPWPVDGRRILRGFGPYLHSKSNIRGVNKGVDIAAPYGQTVRSVLEGKVVYADYFKGYGRLAMVNHGKGFYSLYAHLSALLVESGQRIRQGDLIGKVGDSGLVGEPSLHFELRINGESIDPMEWLRR